MTARLQTTESGVWACCVRRQQWLPADEEFFHRRRTSPSGLDDVCQVCRNARSIHERERHQRPPQARCTDDLAAVMGAFAPGGGHGH